MKKIIFLSLLFISFLSCKNDTTKTESEPTPVKKEVNLGLNPPVLNDEKTQQYINNYDKIIVEYNAAYQSDDSTKMSQLISDIDIKTREGMQMVKELEPEDRQKAGKYFQSKVDYLVSLRQK